MSPPSLRYQLRAAFRLFITASLLIGGLLPCGRGAPNASSNAKPITRLNEAQAVETARAFCRKIGQPVIVPGTAAFATNSQGPPGHYWQSTWDVTFPRQAKVEVVDATGVITHYANDAYYVVHRDNAPAGEAIPQQEAIQRAREAVDAAGQPEPLLFWEADVEQTHPVPPLASSYTWIVRWYRAADGIPYRDQHTSVALDAQTGEIKFLTIMYGFPPLASARKVLSQDDATEMASSQVISQVVQQEATLKEAHLEIVSPDTRWPHSSDKPGQPRGVRLAWAVTFIVDGIWRQADVDTETGELLSVAADGGPMGMHRAAAPVAALAPPPVAPMLQGVRAVYVRGKDAGGKWAAKPLLKFSEKSQPHAVATLRKTADFRKEGPGGAAPQQIVLASKGGAIGVYSYFPDTGLLGSGSEWAAVPDEFKTWVQRKIASAGSAPVLGTHR